MRIGKRLTGGVLSCGLMFGSVGTHAAIVANGVNASSLTDSQPTAATYTSNIVSTDLIDQSQPSLASWTRSPAPFFENGNLNDGTGMPASGGTKGSYMRGPTGGNPFPNKM